MPVGRRSGGAPKSLDADDLERHLTEHMEKVRSGKIKSKFPKSSSKGGTLVEEKQKKAPKASPKSGGSSAKGENIFDELLSKKSNVPIPDSSSDEEKEVEIVKIEKKPRKTRAKTEDGVKPKTKVGSEEARCNRCRKNVKPTNVSHDSVKQKSGRVQKMLRGSCPECNGNLAKFVKND